MTKRDTDTLGLGLLEDRDELALVVVLAIGEDDETTAAVDVTGGSDGLKTGLYTSVDRGTTEVVDLVDSSNSLRVGVTKGVESLGVRGEADDGDLVSLVGGGGLAGGGEEVDEVLASSNTDLVRVAHGVGTRGVNDERNETAGVLANLLTGGEAVGDGVGDSREDGEGGEELHCA